MAINICVVHENLDDVSDTLSIHPLILIEISKLDEEITVHDINV